MEQEPIIEQPARRFPRVVLIPILIVLVGAAIVSQSSSLDQQTHVRRGPKVPRQQPIRRRRRCAKTVPHALSIS